MMLKEIMLSEYLLYKQIYFHTISCIKHMVFCTLFIMNVYYVFILNSFKL